MAAPITPTRIERRTSDNVKDQRSMSTTATTPAVRLGEVAATRARARSAALRSTGRPQQPARAGDERADHEDEDRDVGGALDVHLTADDCFENADDEAADDGSPHRVEPADHRAGQRPQGEL